MRTSLYFKPNLTKSIKRGGGIILCMPFCLSMLDYLKYSRFLYYELSCWLMKIKAQWLFFVSITIALLDVNEFFILQSVLGISIPQREHVHLSVP